MLFCSAIEREVKDRPVKEFLAIRQDRTVPNLRALEAWMQELYQLVTPKSAIGEALAYSIKR